MNVHLVYHLLLSQGLWYMAVLTVLSVSWRIWKLWSVLTPRHLLWSREKNCSLLSMKMPILLAGRLKSSLPVSSPKICSEGKQTFLILDLAHVFTKMFCVIFPVGICVTAFTISYVRRSCSLLIHDYSRNVSFLWLTSLKQSWYFILIIHFLLTYNVNYPASSCPLFTT